MLPGQAPPQVGLEDLETRVDLLVLVRQAAAELGHAAGEHGEEVALLDAVVHGQVLGEAQPLADELAHAHALGPLLLVACVPEQGPGLAEVVVLRVCLLDFDFWGEWWVRRTKASIRTAMRLYCLKSWSERGGSFSVSVAAGGLLADGSAALAIATWI